MKRKIRIGVVGCGQIMPSTAKGILEGNLCDMAYLYDIDQDAMNKQSENFSVPVVDDFWALLEKDDVDAIYLAVPHAYHVPLAVEAARAGKHVMVEKPFATDLEDGKLLIRECDKTNVVLSAAMSLRFADSYTKIKEIISKGLIGDVISTHIRAVGMKDKKYWTNGVLGLAKRSAWRAYRGMSGGGILTMNAVHNLDAVYDATGLKPIEVTALSVSPNESVAVEESIAVLIKYNQSKAFGVCEAMSCAHGASHTDNTLNIFGTKGTIRLGKQLELYSTVDNNQYEQDVFTTIPFEKNNARAALMDDFAAAIINKTSPCVTGFDGLLITDLIQSAYLSAQINQPIKLKACDHIK